jgi:hypothetical protein
MIDYDVLVASDSGTFYVPDTRKYFTFQPTDDAWAAKHHLVHAIDVGDGVRFGIVRHGVAYVAVQEDEYGNPILARWGITKRKTLSTGA